MGCTMNSVWQAILISMVTLSIGLLIGKSIDHWPSPATAAECEAQPTFLRLMGHQSVGDNLLFSVYCDVERGHLIYTYTVAAGESPSGDLTIIKDGCRVGK
ncbi:MAG: hypothetical protein AUI03_03955 [Nitrospirae bacterium 13_2_20CM_2_62_8]|nr:MAG: hypothetical protein AUI03_03955 [Nitrospirae bacterium 13_2_20CM_2_62_8]